MVVTLDTNVIYAGLYSKNGASHQILNLIFSEKIKIALSNSLYFEYYDVLTRKETLDELNLTINQIDTVLSLLALLSKKQKIYYLMRPNLTDEKDNLLIECALASKSKYLITSNIKHFKNMEIKFPDIGILTPKDFFKIWSDEYGK